ncbi:MAG: endopeptidase [Candidatus Saccharibacteria bacterium]|nr:endopeptidase [Candidatus Saccharibacteria bacterium]
MAKIMKLLDSHPTVKSVLKLFTRTWIICTTILVSLGITAIIVLVFVGISLDQDSRHIYGDEYSGNKLLSIKIAGTIVGDDDDVAGLSPDEGLVSGYAVKQRLYEAAEDESIKGVVLELNSPGGTIYGARAITDGVQHYRDSTDKPIIAYIQGYGTSGAYWAAASTDEVVADYGSDVGGIGIIMGPFKFYDKVLEDGDGVVTQNGVQHLIISAGKSKDAGSPYRKLTAEEINVMQQSVNNDYAEFVSFIAKRRGIEVDVIKNKLGAMAYDNKTAQEYKLIDGSGGREDAYHRLAAKAKLGEDFDVIRPTVLAEVQNRDSLKMVFTRQPKPMARQSVSCTAGIRSLAYYGDITRFCQ